MEGGGDEAKVVTTEEAREGFLIVHAILCCVVDPKRVVMRDAASYCAVLLDDNNRKPLCRLRLNGAKKRLGLFNTEKVEEAVDIGELSDICKHAERLRATAAGYEKVNGEWPAIRASGRVGSPSRLSRCIALELHAG